MRLAMPRRFSGWRSVAVLAAAALALSLLVVIGSAAAARQVDLPVERWTVGHRAPGWTTFFRDVTRFGGPGPMFGAGLVLAVLAALRSVPAGVALAAATLLRPLVSIGLKDAVDRPRPHLSQLVRAGGASYPSGHALAATVCCLALPAVVALWTAARALTRIAAGLGAVAVLAVGYSRMYLGVHWLSDVVAGVLFGMLLLAPLYVVVRTRLPTMEE